MIHFVGAGPGAVDLITVRGQRYLKEADVIIYAGSLVNKGLLEYAKEGCEVYNSAYMTLEEVIEVMIKSEKEDKMTVRLHTGDPCLYGAIREQMDILDEKGIDYDSCPGVSSFCGAAAALNLEYTLPEVSQSVIITRTEGRTPVPEREKIMSFAAHGATMVLFLSTGLLDKRTACRRICIRYAGSNCVQSNMAGGRGICMYDRYTCGDSKETSDYKDCTDPCGKCSDSQPL